MHLPKPIEDCMQALERASFSCYAVGGCVRDWLLGLAPQDYDLCTDATPDQICRVFSGCRLLLHGVKHGTVTVIQGETPVEITTFRTEGAYSDNRHPDWVEFVTDLDADLARRDFTVNAMAYSPSRGLQDPFGGRLDLEKGVIRAVGDADKRFQEDALRILRGIRFAARYGFSVEQGTLDAMLRQLPLTEQLARERVFSEMDKLLAEADAESLLAFAPIITYVIPELKAAVGFDQHSPHHAYDLYTHIAYVTAAVPATSELRWAALLHDVGKVATFTRDENGRGHFYGHAGVSARLADEILHRMKTPTALRESVVWLVDHHMTPLEPDKKLLRRRISRSGILPVFRLIDLQEADMGSKGTGKEDLSGHFALLRKLVAGIAEENSCLRVQDLAISGDDLIAAGFAPGKSFSRCLNHLLEQVLAERLPNEPAPLLQAAKIYLSQPPEDTQ